MAMGEDRPIAIAPASVSGQYTRPFLLRLSRYLDAPEHNMDLYEKRIIIVSPNSLSRCSHSSHVSIITTHNRGVSHWQPFTPRGSMSRKMPKSDSLRRCHSRGRAIADRKEKGVSDGRQNVLLTIWAWHNILLCAQPSVNHAVNSTDGLIKTKHLKMDT